MTADLAAFERVGPGEHLERFNAINSIRDFYSGQAMTSLYDLPFAIMFLVAIGYLGGILVLVPLGIIAVTILLAPFAGRQLAKTVGKQIDSENRRFDFVISAIAGIFTVKTLSSEVLLAREYEKIQEDRINGRSDVESQSGKAVEWATSLSQFAVLGVVVLGAVQVMNEALSAGALAACTLLTGRSMQPIQSAVNLWTRLQGFRIARKQFQNLLALPGDAFSHDGAANADDRPKETTIHGRIELREIKLLSVDNNEEYILNGINLDVAEREMIAIVGSNGSGKSLLLSIIRGLVLPTEGDVLIDGKPIGEFDVGTVRSDIMYLPQREDLFHGTILQNITMFRSGLEARASAAIRLLGLAEEIGRMPEGVKTLVGGRSSERLPRGLAQRIVIARALVNRPKVLLFDEPNVAVDLEGDRRLKDTLERLRGICTVVIVSHRPSILKIADRILDLRNGHLESGPAAAAQSEVRAA